MEQRCSFDQVAGIYAAARPDYPEALADDVLSYAELQPGDRILEIGCGSGQATKSFARRGFAILAIDPGAALIRAAREHLASFTNVELLETNFEAWPAREGAFRLVIAAQAWHWVSPDLRFAKAAQVLPPGGSLAVFANVPVGLPEALLEDFRQIYLRRTGTWGLPPEAWYLPEGPIKAEFERAGLFAQVTHKKYPWRWHHTTASYSDFLITRSDYRMLPQATREAVLAEIAQSIDRHGGMFDMDYETHLYIARRLGAEGVALAQRR
jgi:SAM-dependent methyltransferase